MAVYPCDFASHRYREAQQSIYVTIVSDLSPQTHKLRLCPTHFDQVVKYVQSNLSEVDEDVEISRECEKCGKPRAESLFVKAYRLHEEPTQFVIEVCGPCGADLTNHMRISNGKPL